MLSVGQEKGNSINNNPYKWFNLIGKEAPVFKSRLIFRDSFDLNLMKDTVLVLNFWFIACKPCRPEIPYLNKLQEKFKRKKFKLISVAWNKEEEFVKLYDSVTKTIILDSLKINYPIIPDGNWISKKYSVSSYPRTFVIKKGIISQILIFTNQPEESYNRWTKEIKRLL